MATKINHFAKKKTNGSRGAVAMFLLIAVKYINVS